MAGYVLGGLAMGTAAVGINRTYALYQQLEALRAAAAAEEEAERAEQAAAAEAEARAREEAEAAEAQARAAIAAEESERAAAAALSVSSSSAAEAPMVDEEECEEPPSPAMKTAVADGTPISLLDMGANMESLEPVPAFTKDAEAGPSSMPTSMGNPSKFARTSATRGNLSGFDNLAARR